MALPEDEVTRWTVAQMAMQPTVTGEPLASIATPPKTNTARQSKWASSQAAERR